MTDVTYAEVGATRTDDLPAGYHHLRFRCPLPAGSLATAGAAVLDWRLHRAAGVRMVTDASRAEEGVRVTVGVGLGPLRVSGPCRIVWTVADEHRVGFGYGTLPGHPERGEEAFLVEQDTDGSVWFTVRAFSRPDVWFTRAGGPVVRAFQYGYAWWLGRTLRRLCS